MKKHCMSDASKMHLSFAHPFFRSTVSCGDAATIPFECREGIRVLSIGTENVRFGHSWLRRR